ncbi:hypothetical protein AB0H37_42895 [Actinomadura sp. NPDC023710]|uniref:effector-associated domain 2-containing protein n=1 Tax=Actinomadura sp. NPDC023710 TaxID=3158219 RepID=UPI0033FD394A
MTTPQRWKPSGRCTVVTVDIAGFGDRRSDFDRRHVRNTLYESLIDAFHASNIPFGETYFEDRGDGLLVIIPPRFLVEPMLESLPSRMEAILRLHNRTASAEAQLKVRMAIHVGEIHHDDLGLVGTSLTHAFRLLDAPQFKRALATSDNVLALIVSERVYTDIVSKGLGALDPADFSTIDVRVKETDTEAWVYLPLLRGRPREAAAGGAEKSSGRYQDLPAEQEDQAALFQLFRLVDDLLDIPLLRTAAGRQQVVGALPQNIAKVIPRSPEPRADLFAIMQTCLDYPGGLQQFLTAVRGFVGQSVTMRRLEQGIASLLIPTEQPGN